MNVLVLHGPNLNLLGERPGEEKGQSLALLDGRLKARAQELGLSLKIVQSNHEGVLIDTLHAERRWADGIVINPGALAHYSYALREALAAVGRPAIEVHLTDIRRRESWRRKSVIKDVCVGQITGRGFDSYLDALDRLASGELKEKKKGRARKPAAAAKPAAAPKSLGRKKGEARLPAATAPATAFLTRALVRQKISERLSGKITPASLTTWARGRWNDVQGGAATESGQRELLEDALQQLVLHALPASRLSDEQLLDVMTQLDG